MAKIDVEALLASMTLQEKIGQMVLTDAKPENLDQTLEWAREGKVGAFLTYNWQFTSENGWKIIEASKKSRLGIPILYGKDVIHGHWTVFPIGPGLAAGFDPAAAEKVFTEIAKEASSDGIHWTFSPMLDIARDPRWGRVAEGLGEDPYLASRLAEACIRGFQGRSFEDLSSSSRLLACIKHFIGYGTSEGGRDADTMEISRNTLMNIYFPPFLAAMRAGAGSVMSGYNDLDGEPVSASKEILDGLAKRIGGLQGFIVSDYGTTNQLLEYRFAEDRKRATELAVNAGLDMDMCSGCFMENLETLVKEGKVPLSRIDDAVRRILKMKVALNLWERPIKATVDKKSYVISEDLRSLAREAARKAAILLVNKANTLPLDKSKEKIAVMGPYTDVKEEWFGTWTLDGMMEQVRSAKESLEKEFPEKEFKFFTSPFVDLALEDSRDHEKVIFFAGEHPVRSGETHNLSKLTLPPGQEEMIRTLSRLGKKIILVVVAGRPLNLRDILPHVEALLFLFHPGTGGGEAVAGILSGRLEPGGRLPITFPYDEGQIPIYYNSIQTRKNRRNHLRYQDMRETPLFPFGYGLSYGEFHLSDVKLSKSTVKAGESVEITATVENRGDRDAECVLQCYIQDCVSTKLRPNKELKGFERMKIGKGKKEKFRFVLGPEELGYLDDQGKLVLEPGSFKVAVGFDSSVEPDLVFKMD